MAMDYLALAFVFSMTFLVAAPIVDALLPPARSDRR